MDEKSIEIYRNFQKSIIYFIKIVWGLVPQPIKQSFQEEADQLLEEGRYNEFRVEMFKPFIKGKHVSWQQWCVLLGVDAAIAGTKQSKISVASGHGIGKSTVLAWVILWFLFCFKEAQVPCTAPTSDGIHDVLWKEIKVWLNRMPEPISEKYEWSRGYIRIIESPETWFARARTARKENPEALAGVHSDHVLVVADEASGIHQEIFKTAEGALTGKNILFLLISNWTRLTGYFHESHTSDSKNWQNFSFDSSDSPVVEEDYVNMMASKYGIESDEYRVRVQGLPPNAEMVDEQGWIPLLAESQIHMTPDAGFTAGRLRLGVDPSGAGTNRSCWAVRNKFKARIAATERISEPLKGAQRTIGIADSLNIQDEDIAVDDFGVGSKWVKHMALNKHDINSVNVGDPPDDPTRFLNRRAENYFKLREWCIAGGEIVNNPEVKKQLLSIKYRATTKRKIQIMSKKEMRKQGLASPDEADALSLTFDDNDWEINETIGDDWEDTPFKSTSMYQGGEEVKKKKHPMLKGIKLGDMD